LSSNASIPISFFEKYIECVYIDALCCNKNVPVEFFEQCHILSCNSWRNLCLNKNITAKFFEKNLDKIQWNYLCRNNNLPIEFFKKHLGKSLNQYISFLCANNFISHIKRLEIQETKLNFVKVSKEINKNNYIPQNTHSVLPRGGRKYLKVIKRYENFK